MFRSFSLALVYTTVVYLSVPSFSAFRKVFLAAIRELCLQDGSIRFSEEKTDHDNRVGTKTYSYDDNEAEKGELKAATLMRSESYTRYRSRRERMFTAGSRKNLFSSPVLYPVAISQALKLVH